jgi:hypothetical protein
MFESIIHLHEYFHRAYHGFFKQHFIRSKIGNRVMPSKTQYDSVCVKYKIKILLDMFLKTTGSLSILLKSQR